jgi:hypothetical protein
VSDETERRQMPPFPVDDGTLDLLWGALHPEPGAERTSLWDFLEFMSQMGGSDIVAISHVDRYTPDGQPWSYTLRDPQYTDHCVITALIEEVRRVRTGLRRLAAHAAAEDRSLSWLADELLNLIEVRR